MRFNKHQVNERVASAVSKAEQVMATNYKMWVDGLAFRYRSAMVLVAVLGFVVGIAVGVAINIRSGQ